jgi:WD40 repeat protein
VAYDAFISYSHEVDGQLASALQRGLQRLAKPWHRARALRVFRDETGLSTNPHLWPSIQAALDQSSWFVLLASPESAASPWVNREVEHWFATKSPDRMMIALTDGELQWGTASAGFDPSHSTTVPSALRHAVRDEPRHLDLRWARDETALDLRNSRFRAAIADLAAPMHGIAKDELESEDIRQHRRTLRVARAGVAGLAVLLVVALAAGGFAIIQRNNANDQARRATARGLAAEAMSSNGNALDTRLLLAVESYRHDQSVASEGALVATLDRARRLEGFERTVGRGMIDADVSPDGRTFATITADGSVRLYSTTTWKTDGPPLVEGLVRPTAVQFSPDGHLLVTASRDGTQTWDVARRRRAGPLMATRGSDPKVVVFSPDGRLLLTFGVTELRIQVWDVMTGALVIDRSEDTRGAISGASFTADSMGIVAAGLNGVARYDVTGARVVGPRQFDSGTRDLVTSPDRARVALGVGTSVVLLDSTTLEDVRAPLQLGTSPSIQIQFSPDGQRLAAASEDGSVSVFDLSTGALEHRLEGFGSSYGVEFLTSSTLASYDQTGLALWDLEQPAALARELPAVARPFAVVAVLPNGEFVESDASKSVFVVGPSGSREVARVGTPAALAVSRSARLVAVAGQDFDGEGPIRHLLPASITIFELPSFAAVRTITLPDAAEVHYLTFSPDGRRLAIAAGHVVRIIDVASGRLQASVESAVAGDVFALDWSGSGRVLASGWRDGAIREIDPRSGRVTRSATFGSEAISGLMPASNDTFYYVLASDGRIATLDRERWTVRAVPFAQAGSFLSGAVVVGDQVVAIGFDGRLRMWQASTGQSIGVALRGHDAPAVWIAVRRTDSEHVVTLDETGAILQWDLSPDGWAKRACTLVGRNLTRAEWNRYLPDEEYRATCEPYSVHPD